MASNRELSIFYQVKKLLKWNDSSPLPPFATTESLLTLKKVMSVLLSRSFNELVIEIGLKQTFKKNFTIFANNFNEIKL